MNTLKTGMLMVAMTVLLVAVGQLVGGLGGMVIFLAIAVALNFGSYWWSDKLALKMAGAKPVTEGEEPTLHRIVDRMAARMQMPKPKVHVVQSDSPNAFATGRSPNHAAVAATTGIMRLLTEEELEGVMAHEFSHIRNRDVLIMSIVATMAGIMTMIAFWLRFSAFFGSFGRDRGGGMAGMAVMLLMAILIPIAAMIIRLAISRTREYQADASGSRLGGNPLALASALEKLEAGSHARPMKVSEGVSHLFIVNPLASSSVARLFSTHPPIAERVHRLRRMAGRPSIAVAQ